MASAVRSPRLLSMKGMLALGYIVSWPDTHAVFTRARVFIVDRDIQGANAVAAELNTTRQMVWTAQVNVTDWEQQVAAFESAIDTFGRIDYVFPIAGLSERKTFPNRGKNLTAFEKPDLSVVDVNLTAVVCTVSLALQQFRRQNVNKFGFRGKSKSRTDLDIENRQLGRTANAV